MLTDQAARPANPIALFCLTRTVSILGNDVSIQPFTSFDIKCSLSFEVDDATFTLTAVSQESSQRILGHPPSNSHGEITSHLVY